MIKGQLVAGDFGRIIIRIKSDQKVEIGELLIIEDDEKYLLQVYDLVYGSQISSQNLEMVAGMNLEEDGFNILDETNRNYQLAFLKPILIIGQNNSTCKRLPKFFGTVREVNENDLSFISTPKDPLFLGYLRSGSRKMGLNISIPGLQALSHHILISSSTGKGKSNLMSGMLWNLASENYAGILVLDPHDEYYGRNGLGLKDHNNKEKISYYTPTSPPPGAKSLKINLSKLKPEHFNGAISLSDPQRQCLYAYHKKFSQNWISSLIEEKRIEGLIFHEDTIAVVKRKLITLLNLELSNGKLYCQGIFEEVAGENTVSEIIRELELGKIVIIDTSYFSGAVEILVGSLITTEIFEKYKYYKRTGQQQYKPVISIVLEEAPRVLGKKVLEEGSNIFDTIAREGRKFNVGLIAITQLPSEIPKTILANINTKIILGTEMASERQAVIESSPQDLSQDNRNIASLDKGEALVTSTFTKFAVPIKIPLFNELMKDNIKEKVVSNFIGI